MVYYVVWFIQANFVELPLMTDIQINDSSWAQEKLVNSIIFIDFRLKMKYPKLYGSFLWHLFYLSINV